MSPSSSALGHRIMDGRQAVEVPSWPDVDLQPLSLEEPWRLGILSARMFSTVRNRDLKSFERVVEFLETTHRLLPRLVPAIKHMKVLFGLKTMVIMWMLKEGRGMVNIVSKIVQFFPNKLPQYEDQCSPREMFLMRKNHTDFKSLAQTLTMNKERLEDYIKNEMEEQYGERYAQKVEDRLLDYLHKLEKVSAGGPDILQKPGAETEEDRLVLEGSSDSPAVRKLLSCDVPTSGPPAAGPQPADSTQTRLLPEGAPLAAGGEVEAAPGLCGGDAGEHQHPEESEEPGPRVEQGGDDGAASLHFCSKHQRWVKNILRGCPDDCSEELLPPADLPSSSSCTSSSSQDLTPSNLAPCPAPPPASDSSARPRPSEAANAGDDPRPGPDAAAAPAGPVPSTRLVPTVRLVDIASFCGGRLTLSADHLSVVLLEGAPCGSGPSSGDQNLPESRPGPQTTPARSRLVPGRQTGSRPSVQFRRTSSSEPSVQDPGPFAPSCRWGCVSAPPAQHASVSPAADPSQPGVQQNSTQPPPRTRSSRTRQSEPPPGSPCLQGHQPGPPSLTRPDLLQPFVVLSRLSAEECLRATGGRAGCGGGDDEERRKETLQDADSSFDVNALYSSASSGSEPEDRAGCDPDYRPRVSRRRRGQTFNLEII